MIKIYICFSFFSFLVFPKCQIEKPLDLNEPRFTKADTIYRDIFKPWDGIWEGSFQVYQDPVGQTKKQDSAPVPDSNLIKKMALELEVKVRQYYRSVTPYYQQVEITDRYIQDSDTMTITSIGVNKVENGRLWCLVQKPAEKVIHEGMRFDESGTIIWTREVSDPFCKEYFKESISRNTYTIMGYGYYGHDRPDLNPKTWFLAKYRLISDYFR